MPASEDKTTNNKCMNEGCSNGAKMRCPVCIKLSLPDAYFCSQDCFKSSWENHKSLHQSKTSDVFNPWPSYQFSGMLRPFRQTPKRTVPERIPRPDYVHHPEGVSLEERNSKLAGQIVVNSEEDQEGMRLACKLGREVLDEGAAAVAVGVTTDELDRVVHEACIERECYPSPLGYYKFPKSCCTSVNEVICHGIPDLRPLENGDLCNIDVTVYHRGFHGDLNETFFVGDKVSEEDRKLVEVTYECLQKAIQIVRPGVKYREIGNVIQKIANAHNLGVVRRFCGHGINRLFHTIPNVCHYSKNKTAGIMKSGHTFTIEPMINLGSWHDEMWPDDWTAVTRDGRHSAQFEHTLLVTDDGVEILTERSSRQPWFMDQLEKYYMT
ncbi:Methionine aminopeptidase [Aphelenchoides besseyi]|nr:Methionine aminopeptidase [Aphelenchoides besseyi]KAI6200773.1 Methionine aminopeptidase [Aphelenchoides besseyi]